MSGGKNDGYTYEYQPAAMCYNAPHESDFAHMNMDQMKAMVRNAKPVEVHNVARGWTEVNNKLVGEGGGGGVRHTFMTAVATVLEHWEGDSADRFRVQADIIAQKIQDGAKYAEYTSTAMYSAANVLETIKPEVEAMEKPGTGSSIIDKIGDGGSRSDAGLEQDLGHGVSTQQALDNNSGDLSAGKEAQLKMAAKMEQLGAAYASQAKAMGTWRKSTADNDKEQYPGDPGGTPPIPIVVMPTGSGPRLVGRTSSTGSSSSSANRIGGAGSGSSPKMAAPSGVGTDVDSITTTNPRGTGAGATTGTGAGSPGGGSGVGSGGVNGAAGGGAAGNSSGAGAGIGRRGSVNGTGSATGAGRAGMGGAGTGAGMGAGAGKTSGSSAVGRGPLARTKGGVVGEAKGASGSGSGVGSGLHGSRGGTAEGRGSAGLGGAGGAAGNGRGKKKDGKDRPDYLVEDEETWVSPDQNVVPRVVE